MNEDFFQGLDETYQELVLEVGQEATKEAAEIGVNREEELINRMSDEGMTIVEDVDDEKFREKALPEVREQHEKHWIGTHEEVQNI